MIFTILYNFTYWEHYFSTNFCNIRYIIFI